MAGKTPVPRQDHTSPPRNIWSHVFSPTSAPNSSSSPEQTLPPSSISDPSAAPTLALWSRKLSLQSEEIRSLIQQSVSQLKTQQDALKELLKSSVDEVKHAKTELGEVGKWRDEEFDAKLTTIRRLTQNTTDVLHSFEAKLSKLDTIDIIHQNIQTHRSLLHNLAERQAGQQKSLEKMFELLQKIDRTMSAEKRRKSDTGEIKHLEEVKSNSSRQTVVTSSAAVIASGTQHLAKRPRRLMSDEELAAATREGLDEGVAVPRPAKRKLLSTQDEETFSLDF